VNIYECTYICEYLSIRIWIYIHINTHIYIWILMQVPKLVDQYLLGEIPLQDFVTDRMKLEDINLVCICCSVLQCVAVCCSVHSWLIVRSSEKTTWSSWFIAVYSSVLQLVVVYFCMTLWHWSYEARAHQPGSHLFKCVAVCCSVLQYKAWGQSIKFS